MDPETKQLLGELKSMLAEGSKVKAAVQQLEEQMRGMPQTIDNKLKAVRAVAWDDRGRYRGFFDTEDDARCFGLCVMHQVGGDQRALDALKGVAMELDDCAFPTLAGVVATDQADEAFKDADYALLVGAKPRGPGMERSDLLLGNDAKVVLRPQSPFVDDIDPVEFDCETRDWQEALRADWLNSVRTREPNRSTVELGVQHMVAVELATRSLWDGKAYRYDAATGTVSPA